MALAFICPSSRGEMLVVVVVVVVVVLVGGGGGGGSVDVGGVIGAGVGDVGVGC